MASRSKATLAKLTLPRLHRAIQRGRLFALLDQAREHPIVWLSAPAGAGKTTLVASFVEHRELPGTWMQLDGSDADLPSFFYYLVQAISGVGGKSGNKKSPLPLLTPDFLADVEGFARRFFRDFFNRLPENSTLVFDNYHTVSKPAPLHSVLAAALEEIPSGSNVIVISREDPPAAYSRLVANNHLATLGWEPLKLTLDEARDIALGHHSLTETQLSDMHQRSGGWVAGLRLLIEGNASNLPLTGREIQHDPGTLFQYFETQVMSMFDMLQQNQLLRLAYLPSMTLNAARVLAGDASVSRLLEQMHEGHLFTAKLATPTIASRFHDLFRDFLGQAVVQRLGDGAAQSLRRASANQLRAEGEIGEAAALYASTQDWNALREILIEHAQRLISTGQWSRIVEWIEQIPRELRGEDHNILYWLGRARSAVAPADARVALEFCYQLASARDDTIVALKAAATIVQTHMTEYTQFRPIDRWIPILEKAVTDDIQFPDPHTHVEVLAALLNALTYRQPENAVVDNCVEQLSLILREESSIETRFLGYSSLHVFGAVTGKFAVARTVTPFVEALVRDHRIPPYAKTFANYVLSFHYMRTRNQVAGFEALGRIQAISDEFGLPALRLLVVTMSFWLEVGKAGTRDLEYWALQMDALGPPEHIYDIATKLGIDSYVANIRRDYPLTVRNMTAAVQYFDQCGSRMHQISYRRTLADFYLVRGDYANVRKVIDEIDLIEVRKNHWMRPHQLILSALCDHFEDRQQAARAQLHLALEIYSEHDCEGCFFAVREWPAIFYELVLSSGTHVDFARRLIRQYKWPPPSEEIENWPWPIKIMTLGRFAVLKDDVAITFGRKAPRKLLQLIKALVAFGGVGVAERRLIDALWSDLDGDAAYQALAVALRRLRDLFGSDDAIEHIDGAVSLNAKKVWVDAIAFERRVGLAEDADSRTRALSLYQSNFLREDTDERWLVQSRERLRSKYIRLVKEHGAALEETNAWQDALQCYGSGLDCDDLVESFYQGGMRCLMRLGQNNEAIGLYRKMRQIFSVVLGTKPSLDSETLYRQVTGSAD